MPIAPFENNKPLTHQYAKKILGSDSSRSENVRILLIVYLILLSIAFCSVYISFRVSGFHSVPPARVVASSPGWFGVFEPKKRYCTVV